MPEVIIWVVVGIIGLAAGSGLGIFITENKHKKIEAENQTAIISAANIVAESEAKAAEIVRKAHSESGRILSEAAKNSENRKKEMLIEAKDEIFRLRTETDKEVKEARKELQRQEQRLQQKDETMTKKQESIDAKEELLAAKIKSAEDKLAETDQLRMAQIKMLEEISGLSVDRAKEHLLQMVENDLNHEKALKIRAYESNLRDDMDAKAKEIITGAIQRCAADHVVESTVSVVALPNDEMKGRIIGREGRNIRTIETITGVDLIIDDTPEAITLSSFDPVRREIARIALERLVSDGRIHPARIEEMVEKARTEVEATIKAEGERAVLETGVHSINPELIKILGRLRYRTSYGQNVLAHSIEVAFIAGLMASELGVDPIMARRAGLLHDIGKAIDHETDGTHVSIGVDLAKKFHENDQVIHAIEAHHGDVEAKTFIAVLVQAADAISAARPGARRENVQTYIKRLEKLEEIANAFEGVERSFAMQAGREIRIMVKPEMIGDDNITVMAREIVKKIEDELSYPGQIKVHVIRENRAIEYAK